MLSNTHLPVLLLLLTLCSAPYALAGNGENIKHEEHYKWALTLYGGPHAQKNLEDVVTLQATFPDDTYIVVLALTREVWRYQNLLTLEAEGQVGKHFGEMNHWEFNGLLAMRWLPFPWDKYVETSFAVGDGLSYATEVPEVELEDDENAEELLNYFLLELTLGLPQHRRWDFVARIHHRSGVFGLFGNVEHGGANFVTGGIKYRF
jgi:hypothetical protein